jgi:FlaA1/EpsC-like NDP-sugar epimerase
MNEEKKIELDRMRFTKNSTAANFALLAILFDVMFFISIYESNVGSWYYNILIGASILYNLVFMLAAFLCSEGIKNYKVSYSYVMFALGIIQIVRIFIYPMRAKAATVVVTEQPVQVMGAGQFMRCVVYLVLSAACLIVGALIGYTRGRALQAHLATLDVHPA